VFVRYSIPHINGIGKAHEVFKVMQQSTSFFRRLDASSDNYALFVNSFKDMRAMYDLYRAVYDISVLTPPTPSRR
jgi:hypothetical protein